MKPLVFGYVLMACFVIAPLANAQLSSYSQNFESLTIDDAGALSGDGWQVFGLLYDGESGGTTPNGNLLFSYGPFPAPNAAAMGVPPAFSAIASGAQGANQGTQYLNAFSDYECCGPGTTNQGHFDMSTPFDRVQSIVFQEQEIGAADIGSVWTFSFDGRNAIDDMGTPVGCDTEGTSDCIAFIKTIDPNNGNQTNLQTFDSSTLGNDDWSRQTIEIDLSDPLLEGQLLQFGFESVSEQFGNTGVYYDNLVFSLPSTVDGDFNNDGFWDEMDINALTAAIATESDDLSFDMNGDGDITIADLEDEALGWLTVGGANNIDDTGGNPYLVGDANLDGVADGQDFIDWNGNKFTSNTNWSDGNFNADLVVDGQDFIAWNDNKFQSSMGDLAVVPEPSGALLLLIGFLALPVYRRRTIG